MSLTHILILVFIVLALGWAVYPSAPNRSPYIGWSPLGIILLIVLILALTGNLSVH